MLDRDIDIPTGSELLAEAGLPAHAIRNILGENQGRIQHCPGRATAPARIACIDRRPGGGTDGIEGE